MARDYAQLTWDTSGALAFRFSYNPAMVADLKATIPASDRRWDPVAKVWLVLPAHARLCGALAQRYLGLAVTMPFGSAPTVTTETRALDVRYIGMCKDRGDGTRSAFGWSGGEWRVLFPEAVLQQWFGIDVQADRTSRPGTETLYAVLGLRQTADSADIRKAYRRLALQWHPDRTKEPGAQEMFVRILHAYEIINDPTKRRRYDAGLLMEASRPAPVSIDWSAAFDGYRSPLRCGLILCEGTEQLGRFVVAGILAWEDIVGPGGLILSTSWPAGAQTFSEDWIMP